MAEAAVTAPPQVRVRGDLRAKQQPPEPARPGQTRSQRLQRAAPLTPRAMDLLEPPRLTSTGGKLRVLWQEVEEGPGAEEVGMFSGGATSERRRLVQLPVMARK